ncbi:hypothetical protein BDN72DRAFT_864581 [Pluteus cervinus]|uniref:Uncharacterized protein n=1 Tax=Pluteus cervinus TaxID=181527 RepID=A0ACD3A3C6_9AGAR|nr:hypothetical protein BDN72DRAFT_864581 [Pluteus cervinus]
MAPRKKDVAVPEIVTLQSHSKSRGKGKKQPKSAEFVVDTDDDEDNIVNKGSEDNEEDELDSDDDIVYVETKPASKPKGPAKRQQVFVDVPPKRKAPPSKSKQSKSKQADDDDYVEGSSPSKKRRTTVTFTKVNRPLHIDSDPDEESDSDDQPIVTSKTRKTKAKKAVDDSDLDDNTKKTPTKAKGKSKAVTTPEWSPEITPPPTMRPHALVGQVASVLAQALNGTFAKNQAELCADEEMFPDPPSPPPASPPRLLPSSPVMPVTPQRGQIAFPASTSSLMMPVTPQHRQLVFPTSSSSPLMSITPSSSPMMSITSSSPMSISSSSPSRMPAMSITPRQATSTIYPPAPVPAAALASANPASMLSTTSMPLSRATPFDMIMAAMNFPEDEAPVNEEEDLQRLRQLEGEPVMNPIYQHEKLHMVYVDLPEIRVFTKIMSDNSLQPELAVATIDQGKIIPRLSRNVFSCLLKFFLMDNEGAFVNAARLPPSSVSRPPSTPRLTIQGHSFMICVSVGEVEDSYIVASRQRFKDSSVHGVTIRPFPQEFRRESSIFGMRFEQRVMHCDKSTRTDNVSAEGWPIAWFFPDDIPVYDGRSSQNRGFDFSYQHFSNLKGRTPWPTNEIPEGAIVALLVKQNSVGIKYSCNPRYPVDTMTCPVRWFLNMLQRFQSFSMKYSAAMITLLVVVGILYKYCGEVGMQHYQKNGGGTYKTIEYESIKAYLIQADLSEPPILVKYVEYLQYDSNELHHYRDGHLKAHIPLVVLSEILPKAYMMKILQQHEAHDCTSCPIFVTIFAIVPRKPVKNTLNGSLTGNIKNQDVLFVLN